jgi:hypothetical protein
MRERLATLIGELRRLDRDEVYRPNPQADCFFCEFRSLCPLYPEGAPVFPDASARTGSGVEVGERTPAETRA